MIDDNYTLLYWEIKKAHVCYGFKFNKSRGTWKRTYLSVKPRSYGHHALHLEKDQGLRVYLTKLISIMWIQFECDHRFQGYDTDEIFRDNW